MAEAYLETIYNMSMEQDRVRAVDLATKFAVSRPTVSQTVHRLVKDGLVASTTSTGITLTDEGVRETESLLRRHRLAERLLFDLLGMDFINAHEQAHALEHWISPEVEARISKLLGAPETCPHGNPIPGNAPSGIEYLRRRRAIRLADVGAGSTVSVVSISEVVEDETALLRNLMHKGVAPGRMLQVEALDDGAISYSHGDQAERLDLEVARKIWVSIDSGAPEPV
ncbi:MAG TPA: metal-dependent transcriptional regulator [Chloroflexota bacterium]|nr:metal-dependent transcriptional regulator [Chloroflexota bacterium]